MLKLMMLAGLMLLIGFLATATRVLPHGTAVGTVTPQQVYFRLHNDDELDRSGGDRLLEGRMSGQGADSAGNISGLRQINNSNGNLLSVERKQD